jgi:hypothetical protein
MASRPTCLKKRSRLRSGLRQRQTGRPLYQTARDVLRLPLWLAQVRGASRVPAPDGRCSRGQVRRSARVPHHPLRPQPKSRHAATSSSCASGAGAAVQRRLRRIRIRATRQEPRDQRPARADRQRRAVRPRASIAASCFDGGSQLHGSKRELSKRLPARLTLLFASSAVGPIGAMGGAATGVVLTGHYAEQAWRSMTACLWLVSRCV